MSALSVRKMTSTNNTMLLVLLVTMVMVSGHTPTPDDPPPTSTVTDDHKYYTLTVYQNNEHKSFDDNFIDMENAEVKSGMYWSTVKRCLIFQTFAMQSIHMVQFSTPLSISIKCIVKIGYIFFHARLSSQIDIHNIKGSSKIELLAIVRSNIRTAEKASSIYNKCSNILFRTLEN